MGWSIGYDKTWGRDIGYGVPAICDHPGCNKAIDRGLSHVCCDEQPYGGDNGCGLYFCREHLRSGKCERCAKGHEPYNPFPAKPDTIEWMNHKLTDESWAKWRTECPDEVAACKAMLAASLSPAPQPAKDDKLTDSKTL